MTSKKAAVYLGISVFYLRNMRQGQHKYSGPRWTMLVGERGIEYHYAREDLDTRAHTHKWRRSKLKHIKVTTEHDCSIGQVPLVA